MLRYPTYMIGEEEKFKEPFKMIQESIDATGADVIVTLCPSCFLTFEKYASQDIIAYWDLIPQIGLPKGQKGIGQSSDVVFNIHDSCPTRHVTSHYARFRRLFYLGLHSIIINTSNVWRKIMTKKYKNPRILSILAFSFSFAYLLSFLFEGQLLYDLINRPGIQTSTYIIAPIIAHFLGLFSSGFLMKSHWKAKNIMLSGVLVCLISAIVFYFPPSFFWIIGLIIAGYASGCALGAWGYFLKTFTPKNERIKTCADVLILSNLMMIIINVLAANSSSFIGLSFAIFFLAIGAFFTWMLPDHQVSPQSQEQSEEPRLSLKKPMMVLFLFVAIITINSGLMYQVINPAFEHLTILRSWYWGLPYILTLLIMRNFPQKTKKLVFLHVGMILMIAAFISFMLLGRNVVDYLIVNTLLLSACGIFDLFWWSIIGEMLDYTKNPIKIFGIGLSANVLGVLLGGLLGIIITSMKFSSTEVTVIALTVICITLLILPPLNNQLLMLLKSCAYPLVYEQMSQEKQMVIIAETKMIDPLTKREEEVLQLILLGQSNKDISANLFITESTVKTHVRNIYSKYDVSSRAELISSFLKNQRDI